MARRGLQRPRLPLGAATAMPDVPMNALLSGKGNRRRDPCLAEPRGLGHRLWFRSAQPQDAQESLLELQELLLALMLFFGAVN